MVKGPGKCRHSDDQGCGSRRWVRSGEPRGLPWARARACKGVPWPLYDPWDTWQRMAKNEDSHRT